MNELVTTDEPEIEQVEGVSAESHSHALLRMVIERIGRIDDEIAERRADRAEVVAEAKAQGFDGNALREVIRRRKSEPDKLAELDALVETYEIALGTSMRGTIWGGDLRPQAALPKPTQRSKKAAEAIALARGADMAGRG